MSDADIIRKALTTYGPSEQLAFLRKSALEALKRMEDDLRTRPKAE